MPVNSAQLLAGANYQLESFATSDPVDQFTTARPFSRWLVKNKIDSVFGNGIFNEKVRISNDSNYQNYTGDDQVTYNRKDTVRKAPFQHYEAHDGFALNETELADNGIVMTDDRNAVVTEAEKIQLVNKITEGFQTLKDGFQENWDLEAHRSGSASPLSVPGLDLIVSTTPTSGTIGGIDASTATYWRNVANTSISTATAGNLIEKMEAAWRECTTYGGQAPDAIFVGSKFFDAYVADLRKTQNMQVNVGRRGGETLGGGVASVYFNGVEVIWDPSMDKLKTLDGGATDWDKRAYFLNSRNLKLRPFKGRWMVNRKPSRIYDRYTHYFALTADYGITCNKRNGMAVLAIT